MSEPTPKAVYLGAPRFTPEQAEAIRAMVRQMQKDAPKFSVVAYLAWAAVQWTNYLNKKETAK